MCPGIGIGIRIGAGRSVNGFNVDALALINRMIAAGETPTAARKTAINNCIVSLKANNLWSSQFDVLVVTRAHGPASGLMNWIKNSNNGIGVSNGGTLTFTTDVGYNSDGTKSYINGNYKTSSDKVVYAQDDACFGGKVSGVVAANAYIIGNSGAGSNIFGQFDRVNSTANSTITGGVEVGYNTASRISSSSVEILKNSSKQTNTYNSDGLTTLNMWILTINNNDTPLGFTPTTEKLEAYWMGKSITQANFLTFQSIMNTYFATF